jgi:glycosyltransferase involved in cell wall biosynthesis
MACGCIVVGYHGMGGRDFFTPDHGIPVPQGDVVAFAGALEEVLERHARDPETLDELAATAAAHIQATYTPERERDSVLECWDAVLAGVS